MKELKTKTVNGQIFHPIYVVNDWGALGWFIGTNYVISDFGTHSISDQVDHQMERDFLAEALFPDGTVERVLVEKIAFHTEVGDMGHTYPVDTAKFWVFKTVNGVRVQIPADKLMIDLTTVRPA